MNPQQTAAINKLLDELQLARNALEGWRDHLTDPREALSGLTNGSGEVVIGDADTWNKALEYLETTENAQASPIVSDPTPPPPPPAPASNDPPPALPETSGAQSPTS